TDVLTIAVQKDGAVFFTIDGQPTRVQMLERMAQKYNMEFDDRDKAEFAKLEEVGLPLNQLKTILRMNAEDRKNVKYVGIPIDSTSNELTDWLRFARYSERPLRFAVKGDKDANYPV